METNEKDREALISIVKEMAESFTGIQSTKHWAEDVLWFDIPPMAVKGKEKSCEVFENAFRQLETIKVKILSTEVLINGNMGFVCSVQQWSIVPKNGAENSLMVRQTNCFERRNGVWELIHQHDSIPAGGNWDGNILTK